MLRRVLIQGWIAVVATSSLAAVLGPAVAAAETLPPTPPKWYDNGALVGAAHTPAVAWGEIELESGAVGKIHCMNVMNLSIWNEGGQGMGQFEGWGTNACKAPQLEETLEKTYEPLIKEGLIKSPLTVFASAELPLRAEFREGLTCKERAKTNLSECKEHPEEERLVNYELLLNNPNGLHRRGSSFPWKLQTKWEERQEEVVPVPVIGLPPSGQTCYPTENGEPESWEKVPVGCVKISVVCPQIPVEVVFYGSLAPTLINGVKNGLSPARIEFGEAAGKLISSRGVAPETIVVKSLKVAGMNGVELLQLR
jgi:hypothetical protein